MTLTTGRQADIHCSLIQVQTLVMTAFTYKVIAVVTFTTK